MPGDSQTETTSTVRYLRGRPRETVVALDEPVEVDGVAYHSFTVRRLTTRDLDAYFTRGEVERDERPMANVDISAGVLDVLDADDAIRLRSASLDFLPRSWRTDDEPTPESVGSSPSNSVDGPAKDSTAPSTGTGSTS